MKSVLRHCSILFAVVLSYTALSECIFWQIGNVDSSVSDYAYAQFVKVDQNGKKTFLTLVDEDGQEMGTRAYVDSDGYVGEDGVWASGTFASTDSFRIETFASDGTQTGWSATLSYNEISQFIKTDHMSVVATPLTLNVVPEPSSGLLMLVGGALLALRRRRKARA